MASLADLGEISKSSLIEKGVPSYLKHGGAATSDYAQNILARQNAGKSVGRAKTRAARYRAGGDEARASQADYDAQTAIHQGRKAKAANKQPEGLPAFNRADFNGADIADVRAKQAPIREARQKANKRAAAQEAFTGKGTRHLWRPTKRHYAGAAAVPTAGAAAYGASRYHQSWRDQ